jgi:hypothetical protein
MSRFRVDHMLEEENHLQEELQLEVVAVAPPNGAAEAMQEHIRARIPDSPPQTNSVARLGDASVKKVDVTAIHLIRYLRNLKCDAIAPPTDSGLAGENTQ